MCHWNGHSGTDSRTPQWASSKLPALFGGVGSSLMTLEGHSANGPLLSFSWGGGTSMWIPVFAWWALIVSSLAMLTALMARDERWQHYARRVTFISSVTAIGIFATAGAYEPAAVAPMLPVILMTLALSVATILITDTRTGRLIWRASEQRRQDDSLWTAIVRIVNDAPSVDTLLMNVAAILRRTTGARSAVVYKVLDSTNEVSFVGTAVPVMSEESAWTDGADLRALAKRCLADQRIAEYRHRSMSTRMPQDSSLWAMVPLQSDSRPYAAVLLAQPTADVTDDRNSRTLAAISRYVGQTVQSWLTAIQFTMQEGVVARTRVLQSELAREDDFAHGLGAVARALQGLVPVDFLSIAWLDRARYHEDRVSMMTDENHIIDHKRRWPIWESTTRAILQMDRPMFSPDMEPRAGDDQSDTQNFEWHLGCRSRIVMPIRQGARILGTLTLAHRRTAAYGEDEARILNSILEIMSTWLTRMESTRRAQEFETAYRRASQLDRDGEQWTTDQDLLNTILESVDATALRVYRLDADGEAMNLVASAGRFRGGDTQPSHPLRITVSDTPWHRWSLSERTAYRIDQSDPERLMDQDEAQATMMARMKTGWIVPIQSGDHVLGFLDVMEARNPDRQTIREPQRLILEAGARAFARQWTTHAATASVDGPGANIWRRRLTTLNGTIVNPITGIIGSVELIRHKQPALTDEAVKYLNLIEHAASRIHEAVQTTIEDPSSNDSNTHDADIVSQRLFGALAMSSVSDHHGRSRLEPVELASEHLNE